MRKKKQANRKQKQNKSYIPLIMFSLLEVIALQMQTVLGKTCTKNRDEHLGEENDRKKKKRHIERRKEEVIVKTNQ